MELLIVHNRYIEGGGEDRVMAAEAGLLKEQGIKVTSHVVDNTVIYETKSYARLAAQTVWSWEAARTIKKLLTERKIFAAHFHNTFPLISPSAYYACKELEVPVVQTLHNYRLLCPNALLFRDGHVCEDCVGRSVPWPGVLHSCYRGSRAASGVAASMLAVHTAMGTWREKVDVYIALTDFARRKFIEGGLPAEKIVVKPNFVHPDPGPGGGGGGYALFVGRLSAEKGLDTLLGAWRLLKGSVPLKIVGDGPMARTVERAAQKIKGVEWLGRLPNEKARELMRGAAFLVFPSRWYESFPMVIAESFAVGLPVIASDLGSPAALVDHGRTGLHFRAGDAADLAGRITWAMEHMGELAEMRSEARMEYERKYTAERNYEMLMGIYERAMGLAGRGRRP